MEDADEYLRRSKNQRWAEPCRSTVSRNAGGGERYRTAILDPGKSVMKLMRNDVRTVRQETSHLERRLAPGVAPTIHATTCRARWLCGSRHKAIAPTGGAQ